MLARPHLKRLNSGPRARYPEIENELGKWIKALRRELKVVTRAMIQLKAASLAKTTKYMALYPNIDSFRWSSKWLDGFMRRFKFSNRRKTTVAQRLPEDLEEKCQEFLSYVHYKRINYNYPAALIGNMDETPLTFDLPRNTTIDQTGNKTISIRTCGYEKSGFTVVLSCMADGKKLPPMIIFKLKKIPRLTFPSGVIVRTNSEGWMNAEEMLYWIETVWDKRSMIKDPRSLLVMDSFRGHLVPSVKSRFIEKHTDLAIIPGGLTSKIQPLDVSINKSFKSKVSICT